MGTNIKFSLSVIASVLAMIPFFDAQSKAAVVFVLADSQSGQGAIRAREKDCFVIVPNHIVSDAISINVKGPGQHTSEGTVASTFANDIAILKLKNPLEEVCSKNDWQSGESLTRKLDTNSQGVLKFRNESGGRVNMIVDIISFDERFINVAPANESEQIRKGMSGSTLQIGNTVGGMLVAVEGKKHFGRVFRQDYLNNLLLTFWPRPAPRNNLPPEIQGADGVSMVRIPEGTLTLLKKEIMISGSPLREYTFNIDSFYIDKYEVTTAQYARFITQTGHKPPDLAWEIGGVFGVGKKTVAEKFGNRPVIGVTWDQARVYCETYSKRLPTRLEWLRAATGNGKQKYPWGNDHPTSVRAKIGLSNFRDFDLTDEEIYKNQLAPVGNHIEDKSPFGVYDMAGNVDEHVSEKWKSDCYGGGKIISGPGIPKVVGGNWTTDWNKLDLDPSGFCHGVADDIDFGPAPYYASSWTGFRCAKNAP